MGGHGLDSSSQGLVDIVVKTLGFVKYREFLDWFRKYQTLKDLTPCS
jgi:hypothetical protein